MIEDHGNVMIVKGGQPKNPTKEKSLIDKLKDIEELCLPNGATGAVWLEDVIQVVNEHLKL